VTLFLFVRRASYDYTMHCQDFFHRFVLLCSIDIFEVLSLYYMESLSRCIFFSGLSRFHCSFLVEACGGLLLLRRALSVYITVDNARVIRMIPIRCHLIAFTAVNIRGTSGVERLLFYILSARRRRRHGPDIFAIFCIVCGFPFPVRYGQRRALRRTVDSMPRLYNAVLEG